MNKVVSDVTDILKAPFVGELDTLHLFLLVGLVLIFAAAWAFILHHIRLAATEIV